MFIVKSRESGAIRCRTSDVNEAMLFDGSDNIQATSDAEIRELAAVRVKDSPDFNSLPEPSQRFVLYRTLAGRRMVCEVIRLFSPDEDGYPIYAELIGSRPDSSFVGPTSAMRVLDLDAMTPEVANALVQGQDHLSNGGGQPKAKLLHGLRK